MQLVQEKFNKHQGFHTKRNQLKLHLNIIVLTNSIKVNFDFLIAVSSNCILQLKQLLLTSTLRALVFPVTNPLLLVYLCDHVATVPTILAAFYGKNTQFSGHFLTSHDHGEVYKVED